MSKKWAHRLSWSESVSLLDIEIPIPFLSSQEEDYLVAAFEHSQFLYSKQRLFC